MPIIYLIFAHLAADFILQPDELVKWKRRHWRGGVFHAGVHFLFYLIIFFAYLTDWKVVPVLAAVAVSHFFIDNYKIFKDTLRKNYVADFFIDQFQHLLVIAAAGLLIWDAQPFLYWSGALNWFYHDLYIVIGLSLLIIVTYVVEVVKYQFARKKNADARFRPDYGAMFRRVLIFSLVYALLMVLCVYRTAALGYFLS